jgi:hypothetical protein
MSEQEMMLRRINALDFALWELHIFLDTHPCNQEALVKYDDLSQKRMILAEQYEEQYGPLTMGENTERWSWVDSPWPWEADFGKGKK